MAWEARKSVVVPVDFSDASIAAVDSALELVEAPEHIHAIHVLPALEVAEPGVIWKTIDNASRESHAKQALAEKLAGPKYRGIQFEVAFGDPGTEIAEFARQIGADLIVTPTHGRSGLNRLLLGSVAERVLRFSPCPVLVLKR